MHAQEFKIHRLSAYIEELYIAEYQDKLLLLDGGSRSDVPKIEDFVINTLKRQMSDIKLVVSSHMHPDHAGAAPILRKKHNIPIAAFHEADDWYSGIRGRVQQKLDTLMAYFVVIKTNKPRKAFRYPTKLKPDYKLYDQDKLPYFDDWTVIHAPGHTTHQIVLYHTKKQILYAADTVLRVGGYCILPFPINLKNIAAETLLKLSKLHINKVLLAHGGVCENENFTEIFLSLIPKIYKKLKPPFNYFTFISGLPKPIKEYIAKDNN